MIRSSIELGNQSNISGAVYAADEKLRYAYLLGDMPAHPSKTQLLVLGLYIGLL